MTDVLAWLISVWPYILATCGGLFAFGGFIKLLLEIKRLKLQIQSLEGEVQKSQKLIRVASIKDIERFTSFIRDIDQKLGSTKMMRHEVLEEDHEQLSENAIYRLQKILQRYSEESERANYHKQMDERRSLFRPNELQVNIIDIIKNSDISSVDVETIRRQLPDAPKLKIQGDLEEMSELGMFNSTSYIDDMISSFSLSGFGARFVSTYDKSSNKANATNAKSRAAD